MLGLSLVTVPRVLREKLGDEASDALVDLFNAAQRAQGTNLELVTEKFERRLTEEGSKIREELGRVREEVARLRGNLVWWMFFFWVVTMGVGYLFPR